MEEVLAAVQGLTSWDAWAKLISASRASPLARSHALASFNYDEVVVMDGFLEFLTKEKDENKKCAVLSFLQENIVYFLADHRRMEKVCSGLNQLVTATDASHYFRSMVLVTLTHVFIELDMLRAHPAAFEAFVEIILELASPPAAPGPTTPSSRSTSSASVLSFAGEQQPVGARLLRLYATECLREIESAYPTLFAAQLPHFMSFARRDATHVSYAAALLSATVFQHAVTAQYARDASLPSPLLTEQEMDLLPFNFPPDFSPPTLQNSVPSAPLPSQPDDTEDMLRRAWLSFGPDSIHGQTKWGQCEMIALLCHIRAALGANRDKEKLIASVLSQYARAASPLHLHQFIRLLSPPPPSNSTPSSSSPVCSHLSPDDVAALVAIMNATVSTVDSPTSRVLLAHLLPAAEALLPSPSLPIAAWPSAFDSVPVKSARLYAFVASLPASEPARYAPQLLSVLQCLDGEAKATAHLAQPGEATRAYFYALEHYIRRFPSASSSLFPSLASWLEIETGNAPAPSSLALIASLLDRLKESRASLPLLTQLNDALLRLSERSATSLMHYVPVAQRILEDPAIPPTPLLRAYAACVSAFIASVPTLPSGSVSLPPPSPSFSASFVSAPLSASLSASSATATSLTSPSLWSIGNSIIDLSRTALLAHPIASLVRPLGSLLLSLSSSFPDLEIRNRAGFFYRLTTHVPSRAKLHQLLQLAALDEEETAGFVTSLPSGGPPDASPSSVFSPASSAAPTPLRRGTATSAATLNVSPLTLILERSSASPPAASTTVTRLQQAQSSPSTAPQNGSLPVPSDDGAPASLSLYASLSSLVSDYLNYVRSLALDDPPFLQLHLCLRVASVSDFIPLLTGGSPIASPRASFSKEMPNPIVPGSPAEHLNSLVVTFLPIEFYRAVPDVRVPYLSVPPIPDEEDADLDSALSPRPPPPPPLNFPYAFIFELTVQPDFPVPTLLQPRASYCDGDGRSFAAIPLTPLPIQFSDLLLAPRLPQPIASSPPTTAALFKALWKEFTGEAYGESVKHIAMPKDTALSAVRSSSLAPHLLPSSAASSKPRALVLLPPQYHLLLKFSVTDCGLLIRLRTDCWQALVFVDETLEAAFKQSGAPSTSTSPPMPVASVTAAAAQASAAAGTTL